MFNCQRPCLNFWKDIIHQWIMRKFPENISLDVTRLWWRQIRESNRKWRCISILGFGYQFGISSTFSATPSPYANHIPNPVLQNKVMQSPRTSLSLTSMSIPTLTLYNEPASWWYPLTGNSVSYHDSPRACISATKSFFSLCFISSLAKWGGWIRWTPTEFLSTKFLTSDSHREQLGLLEGLNNSRYLLIGNVAMKLKSSLVEELRARGNTCKTLAFSESSSLIWKIRIREITILKWVCSWVPGGT